MASQKLTTIPLQGQSLIHNKTKALNALPSIFGKVMKVINSTDAKKFASFKIDNSSHMTLTNLRKAFNYIYQSLNIEWPFISSNQFMSALRVYDPFKPILMDLGTRNEKIHVFYSKDFMAKVKEWWSTTKNSIESQTKGITAEIFNAIPPACDIPRNRITTLENEKSIKPLIELIPNLMIPSTTCVIAAPGSGKTEACCDFIKNNLLKECQIISITFRKTLADKQLADFKDLGFKHYLDNSKGPIDIELYGRQIIQIDSICRIFGEFKGVLLLDEVESIFEHINCTPFMTQKENICNRLAQLSRNASHIWLADANMSISTLDFFNMVCNRTNIKIYKNEHIPNPRTVAFLNGRGDLTVRVINDLAQGLKVYIPTNSRSFGQELLKDIQKALPNCRVKIYDKDATTDVGTKENPKDPINEMADYDCAIVTPKFQAGNSFTDHHFYRCYAYFSGASCSPEACSQLLMRVRNLKDTCVYMYIDNRIGKNKKALINVDTFEDIIQLYKELSTSTKSLHNFILSNGDITQVKFNQYGIFDIYDPCSYIIMSSQYILNKGYKNYTARLVSVLKSMGYTFGANLTSNTLGAQLIEKECNIRRQKSVSEAILANAENIFKAAVIEPDIAMFLENALNTLNPSITMEDKYSLARYNLFEQINIIDPTAEKIIAAQNAVHPKLLMNKLISLANIVSIDREKSNLDYTLNYSNFSNKEVTNRFDEIDAINKSTIIGYLISCLRVLGFKRSIFDIDRIEPKMDNLIAYLTENRVALEKIFRCKFKESQLTRAGLVRWLNSKLKQFLIKIVPCNKNYKINPKYFIESPWRIVIKNCRAEVLHCPLEYNLRDDIYMSTYVNLIENIDNYIPKIPESFVEVYLRQQLKHSLYDTTAQHVKPLTLNICTQGQNINSKSLNISTHKPYPMELYITPNHHVSTQGQNINSKSLDISTHKTYPMELSINPNHTMSILQVMNSEQFVSTGKNLKVHISI